LPDILLYLDGSTGGGLRILVSGRHITGTQVGIDVPEGEALVEIPVALLRKAAEDYLVGQQADVAACHDCGMGYSCPEHDPHE